MRELIFVLIALSLPILAMADGYSYYPQDYTLIPPSPEVSLYPSPSRIMEEAFAMTIRKAMQVWGGMCWHRLV